MKLIAHNIFSPAYFPHTAATESLISTRLISAGRIAGIDDATHPRYKHSVNRWEKYRLTLESGKPFIDAFLQKFSVREDPDDFTARRAMTYVPAYARSNLLEITNSIHQRLIDVSRAGGSDIYDKAMKGFEGGVDLRSNSMGSFMGDRILTELTAMGKVGIYVDMPPIFGETAADQLGKNPYLYFYQAEDILNWEFTTDGKPSQLQMVLLRDHFFTRHAITGLPHEEEERFRLLWVQDGQVFIQFFNSQGFMILPDGTEDVTEPIVLGIDRIPFVILELSDSLLADVCDIQIALMNLESSDLSYSLKSNVPYYVEKFDPRAYPEHLKSDQTDDNVGEDAQQVAGGQELKTGSGQGRRVPQNLDFPMFIHPSTEPLLASMQKGERLKKSIRELMHLSLSRMSSTRASAESKGEDNKPLEAGLSAIGLELEVGERETAEIWAQYEGKTPATVSYPGNYDLRTDEDRRKEAAELQESATQIVSDTYRRNVAKHTVTLIMGHKVPESELDKMLKEIDDAEFTIVDPQILTKDVEQGILAKKDAADAKGYPKTTVATADTEHTARLIEIQKAQTGPGARGNPDLDDDPGKSARDEKELSRQRDLDAAAEEKTRGESK